MRGAVARGNRIASLSLVTSTYHAGRGIGSDTLLSHEPRKIVAPRAQHRLIYVQSPALLAFGFHDHMDVRVLLIGVKHHRVPVLECELLARELPRCRQYLIRRSRGRHRKHDVVDELRCPSGRTSVSGSAILAGG